MCWCGRGVTRMVTMKASTQSRYQRGRAAMSSSTTTALSRQPLAQALRNLTDPGDRRGVCHDLPTVLSLAVTGVLAAADLEALGPSGRTGSSVGVDHPAGAPGPGPHGPRHSCEVLVLYTYQHHRRNNSHCGGRQDHAWGPHTQGSGAASPVGLGPRHGHCPYPGTCGRQVQ